MAHARELADRTGATFVHPFDDPDVIAGQGTIGLEIAEQVPDAGVVVVPVGGGGLIGGVATALRVDQMSVLPSRDNMELRGAASMMSVATSGLRPAPRR